MMTVSMILWLKCLLINRQINDTVKRTKKKSEGEQVSEAYSTMRKEDLELLLQGKPVPRRLSKNQVSIGVQTEFGVCHECRLQHAI